MLENSVCLPEAAWRGPMFRRVNLIMIWPSQPNTLVSLLLLLCLAPVHPSMVYPRTPGKGKLSPEQVTSSLLKEGVARRGCAERWSWQPGTKACGCPRFPSFLEASRARELVAGNFTRVGPDRGGGQLKAPRGQRGRALGEPAAPVRAGAPPPWCAHGLHGVEWSDRLWRCLSSSFRFGKKSSRPQIPQHYSLSTCLDSFHEDVSCGISFKLRESQSEILEPHNQPPPHPARPCVSPLFKKQLWS